MELMEALRTRRAVRDFTDEQVDASLVEELIAAAILAPSAWNSQPWAFAVVVGAAHLHELSVQAKQYALAHIPASSPLAGHLADSSFEILHGAATMIVVCATNNESQSAEDCCLAGESLMLAAHDKGLGTCWVGLARPWLSQTIVKAELGIPVDWNPVAPIVIGHRRMLPATTPRREANIVWCR